MKKNLSFKPIDKSTGIANANSLTGHLCFILVEPENPDNIGAAARSIKNMGFSDLRLVQPPVDWRLRAKKMAPHADDVLQNAQVYPTLKTALKDVQWAVGTSRRAGPKRGAFLGFQKAVEKIKGLLATQRVALVFGKESKGLDNACLALCDWVMVIPTHRDCPSMNLAQAVMINAFLFSNLLVVPTYTNRSNQEPQKLRAPVFVEKESVQEVLDQLEQTLVRLGYLYGQGGRTIKRIRSTWHRLFKRSGLLHSEVQMFKGFTRRIRERTMADTVSMEPGPGKDNSNQLNFTQKMGV